MKTLNLILTAYFLIFGICSLVADVPATINFQGALKDENGEPVNDTKIIQFIIYDDEFTGSIVWSEYQNSVEIVDGIFSVELGSDTAFPEGLFDASELWITFQLGGDEMSPRQQILSVPYSLISEESIYSDSSLCSYYSVSAIVADSANYAYSLEGAHLGDLVQQDEFGNVNITGDLTATAFYGDGSNLTGITGIYDETYVHKAGPDTMYANSTDGTFHIINANNYGAGIDIHQAGIGINIQNTEHRGVIIDSTGNDGFYVESVGSPSTTQSNLLSNGFEVAGAEGNGVFVGQADVDGLHIYNTTNDGIHIENAGDYGMYIDSTSDDGIYIESTGSYGMKINNASDHGYVLYNAGGHGLWISNAGSQGVRINNAGQDGVRVGQAGNPSTSTESSDDNGFEVAGAEGNGLYVGQADINGILIESAEEDGFHVNLANGNGLDIDSAGSYGIVIGSCSNSGMFISSTGAQGIYISSVGYNGLYVNSANYDGIDVNGDVNGVDANTTDSSHEWGVYTTDDIQCRYLTETGSRTYGKNTGSSVLEAGDIVSLSGGIDEVDLGEDDLAIINVTKASKDNSEAVIGVVAYKVKLNEDIRELKDDKTEIEKSLRFDEGNVNNGDYLSIIVFGQAEVKVIKNSNIKAGKKVTVSETDGKVREIQRTDDLWTTGIVGKALEDSNGKDKIKVYVNCK
ncbi:MAG TPA: hypothetical protein ENL20_00350 [Candidatus Cloacimonetes bacterium]|nr:hypothetical protein [Candidatus Cloacimonadota bacterium]